MTEQLQYLPGLTYSQGTADLNRRRGPNAQQQTQNTVAAKAALLNLQDDDTELMNMRKYWFYL